MKALIRISRVIELNRRMIFPVVKAPDVALRVRGEAGIDVRVDGVGRISDGRNVVGHIMRSQVIYALVQVGVGVLVSSRLHEAGGGVSVVVSVRSGSD